VISDTVAVWDVLCPGAARISVGTALFQSAYTYAQRVAQRLIGENSYADLEDALSFGEFNNAFPSKAP
jgi:hypothetical protein